MKKVELHVHLDGSVRPKTISEILNLDLLYVIDNTIVKKDNANLKEYLSKFSLPIKAMQTKDNLTRIAKEMCEDLVKDEVIYAEVRFAPYFHTKEGLSYDEIVESVLEGIKKVPNIKVNLILCMMRGISYNDNLNTIKCAKKYLNKGVVALDLAGDEASYKTSDYKKLFSIANEYNIPFTIHAGEADGASSINDAISFGTKRIGHGIRVLEDKKVLDKVINNNIVLEVCPTSNIQTKVVDIYKNHPIKELINNNVLVTINTDNRTVSNITLEDEYNNLRKYLGFTDDDFYKLNINAINASFISEKEKEKILLSFKEV